MSLLPNPRPKKSGEEHHGEAMQKLKIEGGVGYLQIVEPHLHKLPAHGWTAQHSKKFAKATFAST
jgi:hypothetical protein